jgi:hypothetical protein
LAKESADAVEEWPASPGGAKTEAATSARLIDVCQLVGDEDGASCDLLNK